ncbi:MAG: Mrp/NBP35 family ATP-binding protein [Candidatus Margulisbacteria bacterium]|nr:Mrp/NBP35 family ATP-binding protein [Candidatus Margulisiibacteriota bacterium]
MDKKNKEIPENNLSFVTNKILVMSNKGGVGKSTFSALLASHLALQGNKVGLLDIDIHGPSQGKLFNINNQKLLANTFGRIEPIEYNENLKIVSIANMMKKEDDAIIWRGPMKTTMITQFIKDTEWGELDYLIIDCPPGTGDEPITIANAIPDLKAFIVTTPQQMALLDVKRAVSFLKALNIQILGLIENMATMICPHCDKETDLFAIDSKEPKLITPTYTIPFIHSLFVAAEVGEIYSGVEKNPQISKYLKEIKI